MTGKLKIFIGYAAGVGKTYRMLKEAHELLNKGVDVKLGYIEPHQRPDTQSLMQGIPQIEMRYIQYKDHTFKEPDIDRIIEDAPDIVLIDELAHQNAKNSRHTKRYMDIEELLRAGINVYTTLNIQHIESLYHMIQHVTGIEVNERIPDEIVKRAESIEFVDIEPKDLQQRLKEGKIYKSVQAEKALQSFFKKDHLVYLRELALREMANLVDTRITEEGHHKQKEHVIAVGISSSPSNEKVIRNAARLASAFRGKLVGIYVENSDSLSEDALQRLQQHKALLQTFEAEFVTLYGNAAEEIGEWCRLNHVNKLVLGRPTKKRLFQDADLVTLLNQKYPNVDVYIIPVQSEDQVKKKFVMPDIFLIDFFKLIIVMSICTIIGLIFFERDFNEANIITLYVLGVLISSYWTKGWVMVLFSSISAVLMFNYFFTDPRFSFEAYRADYPLTFLVMLIAGLLTSALTKGMKRQTEIAKYKSFKTEILLETNKKLMNAKTVSEIITSVRQQLNKLVDQDVQIVNDLHKDLNSDIADYIKWVSYNNMEAGYSTDTFSGLDHYLLPAQVGEKYRYTIIIPLDSYSKKTFEKEIIVSIINDMKIALERLSLIDDRQEQMKEKEREKTRSVFLKSISHDIRTPLTSIIGNISLLKGVVQPKGRHVLQDIEEEATWLNNMVGNILYVTKMEHLTSQHLKPAILDDVIYQAYALTENKIGERRLLIEKPESLLLVTMDENMLTQVLINLIENAMKYTPEHSTIILSVKIENNKAIVEVKDNGYGIRDEMKEKVFEQYFTNETTSDNTRKGLGLGLYLCQTILKMHGTSMYIRNNDPTGAIFGFKLDIMQVIE